MKCNPWRWLFGLIPLVLLAGFAIMKERSRVEADLTSRAKATLDKMGAGWATVVFEGRNATITGKALDDAELPKVMIAVLDTWGVRLAENRAGLVDQIDKYEWTIVRRDNRIRMRGLVPNDRMRRDIIGQVRATFPGYEIEDKMEFARTDISADVWMGGVGFALKQLALLKAGSVDLERTSFSITGDANDPAAYRAIRQALEKNIPKGITLKQDSVKPPLAKPYVWQAKLDNRQLVLGGHVPSDKVRDELLAEARRAVPGRTVVDQLEPADGSPNGFGAAALALVKMLAGLEEGVVEMKDQTVTVVGVAETEALAGDAKAAIRRALSSSYRATEQIRYRLPTVKTITPYVTAASIEADGVALSGYVPSEEARKLVVDMASRTFAPRPVRDQLVIGAGQPPGWQRCLDAGFAALQRLGNGRAEMTDRRLNVVGKTASETLAQTLPADVRNDVSGGCDPDVRIALSAEDRGSADADARRRAEEDAQRQRAAAAAAQAQAQAQAEAEARRRSEEDAQRQRAAAAATAQAQAQAQAQAEAEARRRADEEAQRQRAAAAAQAQAQAQAEAEARRRAEEEAQRQRTAAAAAAQAQAEADARRRAEDQQRQRQQAAAVACVDEVKSLARDGTLLFDTARATIAPASFGTLNRIAQAANRCPEVRIEVEGHTDIEGAPDRNQRLSDRRAKAVVDYLVRAGVAPSRLSAVGYGQDKPIAPNDTAENMARNRRIEFSVKTN